MVIQLDLYVVDIVLDILHILFDQQHTRNSHRLPALINIQIQRTKRKINIFLQIFISFVRTIKLSIDIDQTTPQLISLLNKASRFQLEW